MHQFAVKDKVQIKDRLTGGPKRTRIIMRDHNTGEIIWEGSNKILTPGSQISICKQFGLQQSVIFPTYNTELELDNSLNPFPDTQPYNDPITCLWCAGRSGAGSSANEVNVVSNVNRIAPDLVDGTLNPEEPAASQTFITTARERTVFMYGKLIECAVNAVLRPKEYFVWG